MFMMVAKRELLIRLRSRMLLVSTLVLILGAGIAAFFYGQATHSTVSIVRVSNCAGAPGVEVISAASQALSAVDTRLEAGPCVPASTVNGGALRRTADGTWSLHEFTQMPADTVNAMRYATANYQIAANAAARGVPAEDLYRGSSLQVEPAATSGNSDGRIVAGILGVLFFLSAQLFGSSVAAAVVEEKESRLIEVLLTRVKPSVLIRAKVAANSAVGVAQLVLVVAGAAAGLAVGGGNITFHGAPPTVGVFVLLFAICLFGIIYLFAGLGALVSRTQDLQVAVVPAQLLITLNYVSSFLLSGSALTIASYVPVFNVEALPVRFYNGSAGWVDLLIGFAVDVLFAVAAVKIATALYSNSALRYGGRISLTRSLTRDRSKKDKTPTVGRIR